MNQMSNNEAKAAAAAVTAASNKKERPRAHILAHSHTRTHGTYIFPHIQGQNKDNNEDIVEME
jgi:5,10-methylenetetrahydrofolate reductase